MNACPGCGLANYDGMCPHCRGDQDAYERELVPPFPSSLPEEACGWCDYGIGPCTCPEPVVSPRPNQQAKEQA